MNKTNSETNSESLNRAYRELNVLYEVSCAMRTTLELINILYIILTGVTSHSGLGYNRAVLFLVNTKLRRLECKMAIGPESGEHADKIWKYIEKSKQELEDLIHTDKINQTITQSSLYKSLKSITMPLYPKNSSLLTMAYHQGIPWHLPPEAISQYSDDVFFKHFKTKELVIIPLRAKDTVNGLIIADNIYTQKPITEEDIKIFTMLANQAGLAIENSHLYEMVVQKSHTDSLTNLWNHGFFQEKLTEETKKAKQTKNRLSLIIIDIDNFKKLNDAYGHQYGDLILKDIAQIFRESSREMDYVCRYGGEEFAIILLQTSKEQGLDIAERLRKRIEKHTFPTPIPHGPAQSAKDNKTAASGEGHKITISLGLATFHDTATTKEELITNADRAMYIAKFSGKNKTCIA